MHETVYLSDTAGALHIQYTRAAMEEIRRRAVGGLLAVPRVPVGVGGFLVGVREKSVVRILDSVEVPCSHSAGPGFSLTPVEKNECQEMMTEAGAADGSGRVTVVGWYCSKTRGDGSLSEEDRKFYRDFFSEPWQIAMVARPTAVDDMPAVFYRRDESGQPVKALECVVEAWHPKLPSAASGESTVPAEIQAPEVRSKPVATPLPPPVIAPEPVPLSRETTLADLVGTLSDEKPKPATMPRSALAGAFFEAPGTKLPQPRKGPNKLLIGIAVGVLVLLIGIAGFLTQDSWLPRPPLAVNSSEVDGSLLVRWNAAALRGISRASLYVNDGGTLQTIPMDRFQINSGTFDYKPKTQRVTVKIAAGDISGITTWFAAPPPAPAVPVETEKQTPPAAPK
jgi:proteasome lid subunit RPN8/RPN11